MTIVCVCIVCNGALKGEGGSRRNISCEGEAASKDLNFLAGEEQVNSELLTYLRQNTVLLISTL